MAEEKKDSVENTEAKKQEATDQKETSKNTEEQKDSKTPEAKSEAKAAAEADSTEDKGSKSGDAPVNTTEKSEAKAKATKEEAEKVTAPEGKADDSKKTDSEKKKSEKVDVTAESSTDTESDEDDSDKGGNKYDQGPESLKDGELQFNEPQVEFDWAGSDESVDDYTPDEREKYDDVYGNTLTFIAEKEVTTGKVVSVGKKEVVVNIGYKSEGVIQASEFRYNPDLAAGDEIPVYVEQQEDKNGQLVISHKTARVHSAWENVNEALDKEQIIMGEVKCRTKGGLIVDVFGIEAFLPGSQIDVKPIRDYDMYVGKRMEFKVVKINHEFKNVVVSHKALIEAELEEQKKQIIQGLEKGQVLEGTVKNITSYGVFIDLGGVDGLVHITDLSWGRINHPEEVVELDQKINVVILDFDDDKKRIALGLKQLTSHPWDSLDEKLDVGDKVKGKVVVLADYGAFVEIAAGVEGLVHVSEMSWSQHLRSAQDFLKVGDEIEAVILTLDREDRKMSLGMKQLMDDPWEGIQTKYPVDSKHKAKVRNFTNFGVFVELEEGVDGLIHISDLSWSKKIKHPSEFCNVGDELEVVVLEVDRENRRLSLGHKQLEENPWDVFETVFAEGSVHQGTIIRKEGNQFVVSLPYGVEGYATSKHLKKEDGSQAEMDETLDFKVLEFNKNAKRIVVSHLRSHEEGEDPAPKKAPKKSGGGGSGKSTTPQAEKTTLGDLGVLGNLKSEMEKGDAADKAKSTEKAEKKEEKAEEDKNTAKAKSSKADEVKQEPEPDKEAEAAAKKAAKEEKKEESEDKKDEKAEEPKAEKKEEKSDDEEKKDDK
jgi:small subunit ribosomal protein S1